MPHLIPDRARDTTTTAGLGAITLLNVAMANSRPFTAALPDGSTTDFCIAHTTADEWEICTGAYTLGTNTLTRLVTRSSSNAGSPVNFSAGTKNVFVVQSGARTPVLDPANVLVLPAATTPAVPGAGTMGIYAQSFAGRVRPAFIGPSGLDSLLEPSLVRNKLALWLAAGNSTTITAIGAAALTATGTATASNVATTNRHTWQKRLDYLVTVAATTAVAGWRGAALLWGRGASAGDGGFEHVFRWGPATGVATATTRCFVGMAGSTAAPTDVNPSTLTNIVGVGWDSGDANMQIMHNDGAGAATRVDLGASFQRPSADRTNAYEVAIFCAPNSASVSVEVTNLVTGVKANATLTTDLPAGTQLLAPRGWMSVGGTSSVIGIALMSGGISSDF